MIEAITCFLPINEKNLKFVFVVKCCHYFCKKKSIVASVGFFSVISFPYHPGYTVSQYNRSPWGLAYPDIKIQVGDSYPEVVEG